MSEAPPAVWWTVAPEAGDDVRVCARLRFCHLVSRLSQVSDRVADGPLPVFLAREERRTKRLSGGG